VNETSVEFRRVPIRPIDCLTGAVDLLREQYWLFVGICAVGILIGSAVPLGILMGPMMCGIYLCCFTRLRGERVTFELLFKGFDYFLESLIATLILVGAMMVIIVPLYLLFFVGFIALATSARQGGEKEVLVGFFGLLGVVYLLILVLGLLVGTFFAFVYPLIVDRGLTAVPALKTSFRAVLANLRGMLGLVFLSSVLGLLAACCCYLPVFLVLPITFGATTLAYRKVFPDK
jgi:hypothetical protein